MDKDFLYFFVRTAYRNRGYQLTIKQKHVEEDKRILLYTRLFKQFLLDFLPSLNAPTSSKY